MRSFGVLILKTSTSLILVSEVRICPKFFLPFYGTHEKRNFHCLSRKLKRSIHRKTTWSSSIQPASYYTKSPGSDIPIYVEVIPVFLVFLEAVYNLKSRLYIKQKINITQYNKTNAGKDSIISQISTKLLCTKFTLTILIFLNKIYWNAKY